jgi:hypothetical protein
VLLLRVCEHFPVTLAVCGFQDSCECLSIFQSSCQGSSNAAQASSSYPCEGLAAWAHTHADTQSLLSMAACWQCHCCTEIHVAPSLQMLQHAQLCFCRYALGGPLNCPGFGWWRVQGYSRQFCVELWQGFARVLRHCSGFLC